jgi:hypothetical protein
VVTERHGRAGPPFKTSLFRGTRPLKRWRYVAIFCDELYACAALVQVGPMRQAFWALAPRPGGELRESTQLAPRDSAVELLQGRRASGDDGVSTPGRMRVRGHGVQLDLLLEEDAGVQALCPHGRAQVWTHKQAGIAAHGTLALDGRPAKPIQARAVIDDTAGHPARRTEWHWSAGVGQGPDGVALAWNLVSGINDPPSGSERAVWIAGQPREAPPVAFSSDLSSISCQDGSELSFRAEAQRSRRENLLIVRSNYQAPFGVFSGILPGGVALASGLGVVEHHRARW